MKTSTLLKLCISLAVITFIGVFAGYTGAPRAYEKETQKTKISPDLLSSQSPTVGYVIKEKEGKVALFTKLQNDTLKLYSEYETPVSLLPKEDRIALKNGIEVDSLSDAIIMVENFSG